MERLPSGAWGFGGAGVAGALLGATVWLPPAGDAAAFGGAVVLGVGGILAAVRRRGLARLPLILAPVAAIDERGPTVTFRGWLGRGRRIDGLTAEVRLRMQSGDSAVLAALVPATPVIGRFQVVLLQLPDGWDRGSLELAVEVREAAETWRVTRAYGPGERRSGTFAPGIAREHGRIAWVQREWDHVLAPKD